MSSPAPAGSERRLLLALAAVYLATRLPVLFLHELHNDEVLFMQFSQLMHRDWREHWWLSVDGRAYGLYLAPLQYWIGALALHLVRDPFHLRAVSLLFGAVGLFAVVRLAGKIGGRRFALATGAVILCAPYFAMFDVLFIGEVFAYALGSVFLLLAYGALERWWAGRPDPVRLAAAALAGGLTLLAKDSGAVFIAAAFPLAVIPFTVRGGRAREHLPRFAGALGSMAAVALLAALLARLSIPAQFAAVRAQDVRFKLTGFSLEELLQLPLAAWGNNLRFQLETLHVGVNILPLLVPVALWLWALVRGRLGSSGALPGWLLATWLVSVLPVIVLVKATFVRHHGLTLYLLCLLLGCLIAEVWRLGAWSRAAAGGALLIAALGTLGTFYRPLLQVGYTQIAAAETPQVWASGLGTSRMLEALEQLPPGVVFVDPEWGFPGTAAEVFRERYPQLEIAKITRPLLVSVGLRPPQGGEPAAQGELQRELAAAGRGLSFLFETRGATRRWTRELMADPRLCARRVVFTKRWRGQELRESQRVLCTAAP